jgi:glycosyltransferase involved in cell wall biosynthesis
LRGFFLSGRCLELKSISMIRIALATPYTLPFYCGNSILAERLREGLRSRGLNLFIYNTDEHAPDNAVAAAPDILHTLNADKTYLWAQRFLCKRPLPWVITFTGTDYNSWCGLHAPPPHIRSSMELASALILFHEDAAERFRAAVPEISAKVKVIPQGISPRTGEDRIGLRSRFDIPRDATVFLMVAGIRPVKNLGLAIAAFAEVEKRIPNVILLLVGPTMDKEEAEKVLAMGHALGSFSYLGARPPEETREIMGAADVLLNTSHHEGMPGAVLEAMAAGLPVIASAVPGNSALIRHGENGLLFTPGNSAELVAAVVRLAGESALRTRLGEAGRRIVETGYPVNGELDGYCSLYASLLKPSEAVI